MELQVRGRKGKQVADMVPTGTEAKPDEVAEAFLHLMRDHNDTGSIVTMDSCLHLA